MPMCKGWAAFLLGNIWRTVFYSYRLRPLIKQETDMANVTMDIIASLAKRRGFVYPSSEIYGGYSSTWDYGPLGVEMKRNIKNLWWRDLVPNRDDIVGLASAILMSPLIWQASRHLTKFTD